MKLKKVTKKSEYIYTIIFEKGWLYTTHHSEDVFNYLGDFRYCKNGVKLDYNISTSILTIAITLKNFGDSHCIEST